jgi:phenylpyruvate tautomerase PptA (4-oxalocrotonate tautomerase family)
LAKGAVKLPILTLDTNQSIESERCKELLHKASELMSNMLDKLKGSIMVSINPNTHLMLGDSTEPTVYLELKLFAFQREQSAEFVKTFTEFLETKLGVAQDHQFLELIDMQPSMFGWNGKTC